MIKTYEKYIDEYKEDIVKDYFYGKNELLNKLYGFEDRGEFTIQVLDELLDLEKENQQLKKQKDDVVEYIKSNCIVSDEWTELDFCNFVPTGKVNYKALNKEKVKDLLRMLGETDAED